MLDAAYAYLNWWMNGWAGAALARQGYYFVLPERARRPSQPRRMGLLVRGTRRAGRPCPTPSAGPAYSRARSAKAARYHERMSGARVWNAFMDEHTYLVRRWNEFLAA